jgi:hypothetical protein
MAPAVPDSDVFVGKYGLMLPGHAIILAGRIRARLFRYAMPVVFRRNRDCGFFTSSGNNVIGRPRSQTFGVPAGCPMTDAHKST